MTADDSPRRQLPGSDSPEATAQRRRPRNDDGGGHERDDEMSTATVRRLDRVIIRFAGDSGDGMQLTGDRFTSETASFGND
ncbi:2-oxoglutarate ferredoxin oxidoreductase subunit alpha, partial [Streptomyces sp. PTM05]|nr:2-oxoglutarate ferredoxin oxidoreductase subunit alpha [Streptantibioticus parmotrematis]